MLIYKKNIQLGTDKWRQDCNTVDILGESAISLLKIGKNNVNGKFFITIILGVNSFFFFLLHYRVT